MYGLALEGGGAKGSYHVGVMKAINECGFKIGAVVGTSIGSFNGAVYAQGDFEKLYDLWYTGSVAIAIDLDEKELTKARTKRLDIGAIKYWTNFVKNSVSNRGIDPNKLKHLYESYIDEDKLRKSEIEFGMVTVSVTDKKPICIYKEDMGEGKIAEYLLASSYLPVFKKEKIIDEKRYIDGGFYDNCPISLLLEKKYKDIIEVRTRAIGMPRKVDRKGLNIYTITPSKETGSILFSDNAVMRQNINMGYYDALRVFKGYIGNKYYVLPTDDDKVFDSIVKLTNAKVCKIIDGMKTSKDDTKIESKKLLVEKIIPKICDRLAGDTSSYQKMIVAIIEETLDETILPIYKLYSYDEILKIAKKEVKRKLEKEEKSLITNQTKIMMFRLLKEI